MKFMKRLLAGAMAVSMLSTYSSVLKVTAEGEESTEPQTEEVTEAPAEEVSEPAVYEEAPAEVYEEEPAPEAEPEQEQTYEETPAPEETVTEETAEETPAEPEETVEETEAAPETKTMTFEVVDGYGFVVKTDATVTDADKRETKLEQTITDAGEFVTVWAVPADGFEVDYWELDGERLEETDKVKVEAYEIALDQDHHYTVHFRKQAAVEEEEKRLDEASALVEEETEETEEAFTPVTYTATSGNNVIVTVVDTDGAFPKGTTMKVTEVPAEQVFDAVNNAVEGEVQKVKAVDITFYDADGNPIEPEKPVQVSMKTFGMNNASENQSVVHIDNDNNASVVADANTAAGMTTAEFETDGFSVYVIVSEGETETYRYTYQFYDLNPSTNEYEPFSFYNKAGETVTSQMGKNGDVLEPISTPQHAGYSFEGWYIYEDDAFKEKLDFETPLSGINEDKEVKVYAKYSNVYFLYFYENSYDDPDKIVLTTKAIPEGESYDIDSITAPIPGPGYIFSGWAIEDGETTEASPFTPTESVNLYPIFINAYWLRFVGNGTGASYTEALIVKAGQDLSTVDKPEDPTRNGYKFAGWFTEEEGGEEFAWSGTLDKDTALYAHWTPKNDVEYKVFYWLENANDDSFTYLTQKTLKGTTDAQTAAEGLSDAEKSQHTDVDWNGFVLQEINQQVIKGDGSTVVNVFYARRIVTLTFHKNSEPKYVEDPNGDYYRVRIENEGYNYYYYQTGTNSYDTINTSVMYEVGKTGPLAYPSFNSDGSHINLFVREGEWHGWDYVTVYNPAKTRSGREIYAVATRYRLDSGEADTVITAKYGSDIHSQWPKNPGEGTDWYLEKGGSTYVTMVTTAPVSDTEYYYQEKSGSSYLKTVFMIQNLNNPNEFTEYVSSGSWGDTRTYLTADDYTGIEGFSINAYSDNDARTIRRTNGGDPNATYNSSYNRCPEIGTNYGKGTQSYESGHYVYTLNFYYLRNQYDINFISNGTTVKSEKNIYYEADISDKVPTEFVKGETEATIGGKVMIFQGWFDNEECGGAEYKFDTMPAGNLTLYAKWEPAWYIVHVDPNGGSLNHNTAIPDDSTWFWIEYGDTVSEYHTERNFVEDPEGTFYYHHSYHPDDDTHDRLAYYTETKDSECTDKTYREEPGAYVFEGWYLLNEDGSLGKLYDFQSGVKSNITIQAQWRRAGSFTVTYEGHVKDGEAVIGGNTSPDDNDYADKAELSLQEAPKNITDKYVFDGWEVVDATGKTLDDNDGEYYKPGSVLTLNADWADKNKVIHIQAHYTKVAESDEPVSITDLTLHATDGKFSDSTTEKEFSPLEINAGIDLSENEPTCEGKVLVGWSKTEGGEIFAQKDDTVGVDNLEPLPNELFAVWESEVKITVTGSKAEKDYNGKEQSNEDYTVKYFVANEEVAADELPEGISAVITAKQDGKTVDPIAASGTDAGTYTATVTGYLTGSAAGYAITTTETEPATADIVLVIKPIKAVVTITGKMSTDEYDGSEHKVTGYTFSSDSELYKEEYVAFTGTAEAKRTEAGKTDMGLEKEQFSNKNTNFSEVTFKVTDGYQEITAADIRDDKKFSISDPEDTVYNGQEQKQPITVKTVPGEGEEAVTLTEGTDYTLTYTAATDAGTVTVTVTGKGSNYTGTVEKTYEIKKRPVELVSESGEKVYDGTPLEKPTVTGWEQSEGKGFITGEVTDVKATGKVLLPNETKTNTITYTEGEKFKASNYDIKKTEGELKITSRNDEDEDPDNDTYKVSFTANSGTFTYDGKEKTVEGFTTPLEYTNDKGVKYTISEISAKETQTNAGEYPVKGTGTAVVKDPEGNDVTSQFTVSMADGKLIINKSPDIDVNPKPDPEDDKESMDAESKSITVVYDGKEHTVSAEANREGSVIEYSVDGGETWSKDAPKQKNVGSVEFSVRATNPNYETVTKDGYTLTVTPAKVTVKVDDKTKTYGDEDPEFTAVVTGMVEGETLDYTLSRKAGENVGEYAITAKINGVKTAADTGTMNLLYIQAMPLTTTVTSGNYEVEVIDGTLTIEPAKVTVTVNDASKKSGESDPTFTAKVTGLKGSDTPDKIQYSIVREPGEKEGTYVISAKGLEAQGNYLVSYVPGKLTITEAPQPKPDKVPNTSDHNRTPGYLAMLMISILTGMFAFGFRKRYE